MSSDPTSTPAPVPDASGMVPYFYVATVQGPRGELMTRSNVVSFNPQVMTRSQVYAKIREEIAGQLGFGGFNVLFFSLGPERF
ncbi:hypothetical protein ACTWJ8_20620 [Streptomyces sp. SDT5-1]|uniref:hypothetical protein n=1 Tax=Streptomyces sp. SDT5-1 TaxID=3406418 RepID=UPI003FD386F5